MDSYIYIMSLVFMYFLGQKLVVDDDSSDATGKLAISCGVDVIRHTKPFGVGISFRDGVQEALRRKADYAVSIDADGQMNPMDIEKLLNPICGGRYGYSISVYEPRCISPNV